MPVGRLTEEEYEAEMGRKTVPAPKDTEQIKESHPKGRGDSSNTPDVLRKIIGEAGVIDGRQEALSLAKEFGISPSSASAYAAGSTSTATYNTPSQSILQHINKSRIRAVKRASSTLNAALGSITQEKLDYTDAKDLSLIAKNMSGIIKDLEPPTAPQETVQPTTPKFVIFAPQFRKEDSFEVIDIKE